jgi:hypothetical protein
MRPENEVIQEWDPENISRVGEPGCKALISLARRKVV